MQNLKVAVNDNSNNKLNTAGTSLRKRLLKICFESQKWSFRTQTDLKTNITIELFIKILNRNFVAEFSKIIHITLNGYGRLEIDLITFLLIL